MIIELIILLFLGFITGIFSGLLGIGGGILFIPILYFVFDYHGLPHDVLFLSVVSTSLFSGSFASTSSAVNHYLHKNVCFKEAMLLSLGAMTGALITPVFVHQLDSQYLKYFLVFILSILAIQMWVEQKFGNIKRIKVNRIFLIPIGLLIGSISSASGIGGGVFFLPALYYLFGADFKKSVGTAVVPVAITMISAAGAYLTLNHAISDGFIGNVYIRAGLTLGIGSVAGAFLGTKLVFKISVSVIKKIFSLFLIAVILKILMS